MDKLDEGVCIRDRKIVALRGSESPSLRACFSYQRKLLKSAAFSRKMPCGNDMIDTRVENLMDRQAAHRFTTVAWKSLRLSHKADYY